MLEQIVGDIDDEHDHDDEQFVKRHEGGDLPAVAALAGLVILGAGRARTLSRARRYF